MVSVLLLLVFASSLCVSSPLPGCHNPPNVLPLVPGTEVPVASCSNAALTAVEGIVPNILVAHIYGNTPEERGTAYGTVLRPYIQKTLSAFYGWVDSEVESVIPLLPEWMKDIVAKLGVRWALDWQYLLMKNHIPADFVTEVQAAAKAAGVDARDYMNLQVFPELVKAACTMVGAWGSATPDGKLVQLRALDWAVNTPLQQWPLVSVFHQNSSSAFSMLSWPGFHGALTGMSTRMGVCEKVWLAYKGESDRAGIPFTVLLRNILESDVTLEDAISRMKSAKRTCSVWLGIGSWAENKFNAVGYSYENVTVYDDSNLEVGNTAHPQIKDVVYVDKHKQPSSDPCLGNILQAFANSQITAEVLARNATAISGTGDTHLAVYDYTNMKMYVSNASPYVNKTAVPAYSRPFVVFDMKSLFGRANTN